MSEQNTLNVVLPYCGEAEGIDQSSWLDSVKEFQPSQLPTRLFVIYSTTCDKERFRTFIQRAKDLFNDVIEVPKYKPSPLTFEQAIAFNTYAFMTAWPSFAGAGAGVMIDPLWVPTEKYWMDNFIATMRVNQKKAIAVGTNTPDTKSNIYGCLGYAEDFFTVFKNYKRFVKGSDIMDRIAWEFKKHGHHSTSDETPFDKISTSEPPSDDVFEPAKILSVNDIVEESSVNHPPMAALFPSEKAIKESLVVPETDPAPEVDPAKGETEKADTESFIDSPASSPEQLQAAKLAFLGLNAPASDKQENSPKVDNPKPARKKRTSKKTTKKKTAKKRVTKKKTTLQSKTELPKD